MNIFILVKKEMINRGLSQVDFHYDRLLWAPKSVSPKNIVSFRKLMKTNENIAATRNLAFHSVTNIFHFNYFPFSYSI